MLIINNIQDFMNVISSLKTRGILLKRTTRKINSQKGGLLSFLAPLTRVALSLMKSVLATLAKSVLIRLGLTRAASTTDLPTQKKYYGSGKTTMIISNKEI